MHSLIITPLDRMTLVIKKLAGTICILSANSEDEQRELTDGYETHVIEQMIGRMAEIFSIEPDHSGGLAKPLAMMTGTKHTEIQTHNTVVSIEVVERPRELVRTVQHRTFFVPDERS